MWDGMILVPVRDCGDCTVCCTWPTIDKPEIQKESGVTCKHCTAQGCGMGTSIAADARHKILAIPGVTDAQVDIVWDPPWTPQMISPDGREPFSYDYDRVSALSPWKAFPGRYTRPGDVRVEQRD